MKSRTKFKHRKLAAASCHHFSPCPKVKQLNQFFKSLEAKGHEVVQVTYEDLSVPDRTTFWVEIFEPFKSNQFCLLQMSKKSQLLEL